MAAPPVIPLFTAQISADVILIRFNQLINLINASVAQVGAANTSYLGTFTVATLPAAPASGSTAFASDGRMIGEGAGAGSGCPVFWAASHWRTYYNCATVTA